MKSENRRICILQPNYLPWKGVFDLINRVDVFVFLDDVQYTEHDWRNRNKIKTKDGVKWIVVPVKNSKRRGQLILEAEIDNRTNWQRKHYNSFVMNYSRAPYFKDHRWIIEKIFMEKNWDNISELNIHSTRLIADVLGIQTHFKKSSELKIKTDDKQERIIEICKKLGAKEYLSGPAAREYLNLSVFNQNDIKVEFIEYKYAEYQQLFPPFSHSVTVLDVLFNCGLDAKNYININ